MDFSTSKTENLFQQMIREFAEKEVKPLAASVDEEERFPEETVKKMAELGIMGIPFPKEYGGAGGNNTLYSIAVEELSRVCATTGVIVSAHTSLCASPIYEFGSEEQKKKYLPKLCSGEWIGAFGLTEPNAGTDASPLKRLVQRRRKRSLYTQRFKDLYYKCRLRTRLHRHGHDRQITGNPRYFSFYRKAQLSRIFNWQKRKKNGYPGIGNLRIDF